MSISSFLAIKGGQRLIDRSNYVIATVARGYHPKAPQGKNHGLPTTSINILPGFRV
jgi:hypothetical protein